MIKKFKLGKDALILSIMTLITVLSWIGFEIYRTATMSTISRATREQMTPLNPKIEKTIIEDIKKNLSFSEGELNIVVLPPEEFLEGGGESPKATSSGQPATSSGILEE